AEADFRRAVALDHINAPAQAALAALAEGKTPVPEAYDKAAFDIREWGTTAEASALPSIHAAAADAERQFPQNPAQAEEMLSRAIALTDATHRHYHRLAALPWLARGKAFMLLGERELARNDARRGLDLDKENSGLKALLAS
ncbi:MAG: hypothetical protein JO089_07615, partial [Alphaproteobacteria bacterium]|nr:hypothetical protein [Alphaproteobacteria bacterium]